MVDPPFLVEPSARQVSAWSTTRLPFEPKDWLVDFRAALRSSLGSLRPADGERLVATYRSSVAALVDVENVLTYNVGVSYLAKAAQFGFTLERSYSPSTKPLYAHEMTYALVSDDEEWSHWRPVERLASVSVPTTALRSGSALDVWRATARRVHPGPQLAVPQPKSPLLISLCVPTGGGNAMATMKPLTDGVLAACHRLTSPREPEVLTRLAQRFPTDSPDSLRELTKPDVAPLGDHKFLLPRAQGLQVSPADDRLVGVAARRTRSGQARLEIWSAASL